TTPFPGPEPDAEIHPSFAIADHGHAASAVTLTLSFPPVAVNAADAADSVAVHDGGGGAAACDTVTVSPATVSVPSRAAPVFCTMLNETVPFPVPEPPPVTVI